MKKRILCTCLALILCLLSASPAFADAKASGGTRQAVGRCAMSVSGKTVSFSATSTSGITEDVISASAYLWENHSGTWICVGSVTDTRNNTWKAVAGTSAGVAGNYYYRVTGSHYSETGGVSYTSTSYTGQCWIPA